MEELSVSFIRRLSDKSVLRARNSISIDFSDGRHMVVIPVMGYGKVVKTIDELRLNQDAKVLVRISFIHGHPSVTERSDLSAHTQLPDYIRAAILDEKNWLASENFDHIRAVMAALAQAYPLTVS